VKQTFKLLTRHQFLKVFHEKDGGRVHQHWGSG